MKPLTVPPLRIAKSMFTGDVPEGVAAPIVDSRSISEAVTALEVDGRTASLSPLGLLGLLEDERSVTVERSHSDGWCRVGIG
ncbi:MAG: hypothetical protein ACRC00_05790 [Exiguobacterium acetylicum]